MNYLILLFVEIIILFLLSRSVSKMLSSFLSISWLSIIFLPGIIIHELSHLFLAMILFVPVGEMEFVPRKNGDSVKLGSVEIAKTDPLRRCLIGSAPFFTGLMLLVGIVYFFSANLSFFQSQNPYLFLVEVLVLIYILFAVSNTMFSSPRDMEGTVEILVALLVLFLGAYLLGFRPDLSVLGKIFTKGILEMIQKSAVFLSAPIVIDVFILGGIKLLKRSWK